MRYSSASLSIFLLGGLAAGSLLAEASKPSEKEEVKTALGELNSLIGGWRGVGQPQRNSTKDAWTETADWSWHFDKDAAALRYSIKNGKLLETADLTYDAKRKLYLLTGEFAGKTKRAYEGSLKGNQLILESKEDADGFVYRLTVNRLNEKRTLVLHEKRKASQNFYARVAEVGYTREGTSLAIEGAGEPECVVSGGKGTIKVTHKGETYYVCCTGCKQAFDDDPEGVLADYRMKLEERKKKASAKPGA